MQEFSSGFVFSTDERDKNFAFSTKTVTRPDIKLKDWWADGWWGNQGNTPHCCAYSWVHVLEDGPVVQDLIEGRQKPMISPAKFYERCKQIDGLKPGTQGTTIRAGGQVAKELGLISEYRWVETVDELTDALLIFGPVIIGALWFEDMNRPNSEGIMRASGKNFGRHAFVLNGIDLERGLVRVKNSYGKKWGRNGYANIPLEELEKLYKQGASAVVPFELKLKAVPKL